jgi:hypothetical protein
VPFPDWLAEPNASLSLESGLREVVQNARSSVRKIFDDTSIEVLVCRPESWLG